MELKARVIRNTSVLPLLFGKDGVGYLGWAERLSEGAVVEFCCDFNDHVARVRSGEKWYFISRGNIAFVRKP